MVSGPLAIQKLGHITLPVHGVRNLGFGLQGDFIVGYKDNPDLFYHEFKSESFKLIWQKTIPQNQKFNSRKYTIPSEAIFLQINPDEVCLYDPDLSFISKVRAPGFMIGLLHGGRYAVVDNKASPGAPIKLSVVSILDLGSIHHHLDVPPKGQYGRDDVLIACGHEESGVAVTVLMKPFVDIYNDGELSSLFFMIRCIQ